MQLMKNKKLYLTSAVIYICLCSYTLISFLLSNPTFKDKELITLFFLKMITLTCPIGITFLLIYTLISDVLISLGINLTTIFNLKTVYIIFWFIMVILGYIQWFVLLPKLPKLFRFITNKYFKTKKG